MYPSASITESLKKVSFSSQPTVKAIQSLPLWAIRAFFTPLNLVTFSHVNVEHSIPASRSFPTSRLFALGGQSIRASASASILPMNIQGWFPLGWTGLTSLQSKGLSRVFSNTTVQKHQFFRAQLSLWSNYAVCSLSSFTGGWIPWRQRLYFTHFCHLWV